VSSRATWTGLAALGVTLVAAPGATAAIAPTLHADPACETRSPHPGYEYVFCDDGKPSNAPAPGPGGLIPNTSGAAAVTVPAKYGGDGYTGLPAKAADAGTMPGANSSTGEIALDVDVSLPTSAPPAGGYPLIVLMHGCCGGNKTGWEATSFDAAGERWHYNNAWFASRGYAVITYTARGFIDNQNRGSTGETQLDSRRFEINDYQHLACQVTAGASDFEDVVPGPDPVTIDPQRVVATGGSYGGGFTWLAATDPKWTCNAETGAAGTEMSLAAAAPKYGWTDLAYTLVPNGLHSQRPGALPATNGCDTGPKQLDGGDCPAPQAPVGTPKMSIVAGLYATGNLPTGDHTTFPPSIHEALVCLNGPYPPELNPGCANTIDSTLPEFLRDRSAYYQNDFFASIAADPSYRVPTFNAATFTDPLFPPSENTRMHNRLLETVPGYPLKAYFGDVQHFVQNKDKEWADVCGPDRHVCEQSDYPGGDFNADPTGLVRTGITTRLNRFIDFYAQPADGYGGGPPEFDVTASLQVCPENAGPVQPADEPGESFTAATFEELTPGTLIVDYQGIQRTQSNVEPNDHAIGADPVFNQLTNNRECPTETGVAEPGVASYSSDPLPGPGTMLGAAEATIDFELSGPDSGFQLNARLYDLYPNGTAVMVDRGTRRVTPAEAAAGQVTYELHGNGWRFVPGHRIRIEVAQDDEPYVTASDVPSTAELSRVVLRVPIREGDFSVGGSPDARPGRCVNEARGTAQRDRLEGTQEGDKLSGRRGNDRLKGRHGDDCLRGGAGRDRAQGNGDDDELRGGPGSDRLGGGSGKDKVKAKGGGRDRVDCGKGKDKAVVDRRDRVRDCEKVRR
jgi:dienelactone hydrolase